MIPVSSGSSSHHQSSLNKVGHQAMASSVFSRLLLANINTAH
ncbi:hypothetical protein BIW11_02690 [Tropilaelaps mercedesae]|uniref:Uncharacterized protein n=1 Tax=Tropilaelaps mercedesae TaxID=418985 RepID=A0A1V9XYT4_9ACAR|nr:hypothetical protein BIW11_02690 [Tropilaelaps mercedesae]